jgi:hypothetical protein
VEIDMNDQPNHSEDPTSLPDQALPALTEQEALAEQALAGAEQALAGLNRLQAVVERTQREYAEVRQDIRHHALESIKTFGTADMARTANLRGGRKLTRRFWNLSLDEHSLELLAKKVKEVADENGDPLVVEVISGDEADQFYGDDPTYFKGDAIPRVLTSVMITNFYHAHRPLVTCSLLFDAGSKPRAEFTVYGENSDRVSGLSHELERLLKERQGPLQGLSRALNPSVDNLHMVGTNSRIRTPYDSYLCSLRGVNQPIDYTRVVSGGAHNRTSSNPMA